MRTRIAGYKVPRSLWLVDGIARTLSGKADYRWAHAVRGEPSGGGGGTCGLTCASCSASSTRSSGFSPSEQVVAAISRAGGLGVLGCVRFNDADELDAVLSWLDAETGGRPYGVDVVMPSHRAGRGRPGRPGDG